MTANFVIAMKFLWGEKKNRRGKFFCISKKEKPPPKCYERGIENSALYCTKLQVEK